MAGRSELSSRPYRRVRAAVLAESDVCIVCGHGGSDAVDHITPVAAGGPRNDPDNLAPIHGVAGCPSCGRKCNSEKGDRPLSQVNGFATSRDWFVG